VQSGVARTPLHSLEPTNASAHLSIAATTTLGLNMKIFYIRVQHWATMHIFLKFSHQEVIGGPTSENRAPVRSPSHYYNLTGAFYISFYLFSLILTGQPFRLFVHEFVSNVICDSSIGLSPLLLLHAFPSPFGMFSTAFKSPQ